MPGEFLPPVVTQLEGEILGLVAKIAEAKALMKEFNDGVQKQSADAGRASGRDLMEEFRKAVADGRQGVNGEFGRVVGDFSRLGRLSGQALQDEFSKALQSSLTSRGAISALRRDLTDEFARAGKDGATTLFQKFSEALAQSGSDNGDRVGQALSGSLVKAFEDAMGGRGQGGGGIFGFFKNIGPTFSKIGTDVGQQFSGGFLQALKSIFSNPIMAAVGVAVVGSLISEVLAGLSGLGTAAFGLAGITAGIVGAIKDPTIKQALSDLGSTAGEVFRNATGSFINPLDHAIAALSDFFTSNGPAFAKVFEPLSQVIPLLEKGIEDFITAVLPGLQKGMANAAPLVALLAQELPEIGKAIGDFFEKVSRSDGAKAGLVGIIDLIDELIRFLGNLLEVGSNVFEGLVKAMRPVATGVDDTLGAFLRLGEGVPVLHYISTPWNFLGDRIAAARDEVNKMAGSMKGTAGVVVAGSAAVAGAVDPVTKSLNAQRDAVNKLHAAYDDWFGKSMTVLQAQIDAAASTDALTASLKQNKGQWDLTTQAGRDHYQALKDAIQKQKELYDAEVKQYGDNPKFLQQYQATVDSFIRQAQNAGLDSGAVQDLTSQFGDLFNMLRSAPPPPTPGGWSSLPFMAAGGFVKDGIVRAAQGLLPPRSPGTLVLAGEPETGGEVMIPQRGISRARAAALGMVAMAPYGMTVGAAGGGGNLHVHVMLNGREIAYAMYPDLMSAAGQQKKLYGNTGLS